MAQLNSTLASFETIFIPSSPEYGYLSSSMVKEIHTYGGDVSSLVPKEVLNRMSNE
jgi:pantetheine-phosphate adenylyltransferase